MPKVVREDIDPLNSVLTITIEKTDYEQKYNSELQRYRKDAHLKGFRRGKTPLSVVRKMYGKAALADVVNNVLQKELNDFLGREGIYFLGQPIPSADQDKIDFDVRNLHEFVFKFDIGLAPDFEIAGLEEDAAFERYDVEIDEEAVEEDLSNARKRLGERIHSGEGEDIRTEDLLKLKVQELDGSALKEEGLENEISLHVGAVLGDETKDLLLSKKVGDQFPLNLLQIEKEKDETFVRKHFLQLEDDDDREISYDFQATITEASRIQPAELNQEFYDKFFGNGAVSTEDEAREKIRESIKDYYNSQAEALMFSDLQKTLLEKNQLDLPNEFLKRLIRMTNEKMTEDLTEKEYEQFAENIRWNLIKGELMKRFDLKIETEEIHEHFKERIRGYFGARIMVNEEMVNNMANRLMQDEKQYNQVAEELTNNKIFEAIKENYTITPKSISMKAFDEILEQRREDAEARNKMAVDEAAEEEE